jgi:hypothetical protein
LILNFLPARQRSKRAAPPWCSCQVPTAGRSARPAARPGCARHQRAACGGGHRLNGALLRAGLVDELLLYLAPKLLGPGRGMADMGPLIAGPGAGAGFPRVSSVSAPTCACWPGSRAATGFESRPHTAPALRQSHAMFTGIITGSGADRRRASPWATRSATASAWSSTAACGLSGRCGPGRQHCAQWRLHDGHQHGCQRTGASPSTSLPSRWTRPGLAEPGPSTWKKPCAPTTAWVATWFRAMWTA